MRSVLANESKTTSETVVKSNMHDTIGRMQEREGQLAIIQK
jgi:hypothetical protein